MEKIPTRTAEQNIESTPLTPSKGEELNEEQKADLELEQTFAQDDDAYEFSEELEW